jgi:enamine deaminase RidA (YjgF/YER057c/UK114 family)
MDIASKLAELNIVLPEPVKPIAAYVPAVRTGNLLYIAGQLPAREGKVICLGAVPSKVSVEEAQAAAGQCAINALSIVKAELAGDWSKLIRAVRVGAFVCCDNGFAEQAQVANGASELLMKIMGDAGKHARAAVGVNALPRGASVEVEFLFEVR